EVSVLVAARLRLDQVDASRSRDKMINVALAGLVEVVRHIPAVRAEFVQCLTDCLLRPSAPSPVEGAVDEALCMRFGCEHEREEERGRGEAESMPESKREHEP